MKNTENYIIFLFSIYNIVSFCCSKLLFTVSLALIIEASLEAYFQFWLQSNYSLPDILEIFVAKDFNLKHLVTFRTVSILLSFITITVSIVKIRFVIFSCPINNLQFNLLSNKEKNEALNPINMVILVLKVFMDLISRVLIFFIFMIVHDEGRFSPMRTLISFYTMVGIMTIFNIVFNERRNFCSVKYWLGECYILGLVTMML